MLKICKCSLERSSPEKKVQHNAETQKTLVSKAVIASHRDGDGMLDGETRGSKSSAGRKHHVATVSADS